MSDTGYVPATEIHKTQPYTVYEIRTSSGKTIEGADIHLVYRQTYTEDIFVGLDNYKELFADPVFMKSVFNTVIFVVAIVFFLFLGFNDLIAIK